MPKTRIDHPRPRTGRSRATAQKLWAQSRHARGQAHDLPGNLAPGQKPAERAAPDVGDDLLFLGRPAGRACHRLHGFPLDNHGIRSGAPIQRIGGTTKGDGEDDRRRTAGRRSRARRLRRGPHRNAGPGRRRAVIGRRHDSGRSASARGQGSIRQSIDVDRGGDAGREICPRLC